MIQHIKSGFSLLEMAVVLTIIGLIIGASLVGQDMMHSAEINNLLTQLDKYKTTTDTFRIKYESLPGDMPDAFDQWGATASCTNADVAADNEGCNGDGDNLWETNESFRYWHHLFLAGLADGVWNCAVDISACSHIPSEFGPDIAFDGAALTFYATSYAIPSIMPSAANVLQLSGSDNGTHVYSTLASLKPVDAARLDDKIDDGLPETGKVQAATNNTLATGDCVDTAPTPHIYEISNDATVVCNVWVVYE